METVTDNDRIILLVLDELAGTLTKDVRKLSKVYGRLPARQSSALIHGRLVRLEIRGLVSRLDNEKPVCWCRTKAGTAAVTA